MKKLILISILAVFGMTLNAQTNYSPEILSVDIPYNEDTTAIIHRKVFMNIKAWNNKEMIIQLIRTERISGVDGIPFRVDRFPFSQIMDSTYTHTRDNGTTLTQTGRWFVTAIFDNGAVIEWELFKELGRSIYFEYWDINQEFIKK